MRSKSTIGTIQNIFFQIRSFCSRHKWITIGVLIVSVIALLIFLKRKLNAYDPDRKRAVYNGSGILGEKTPPSKEGGFFSGLLGGKGGYFHLDGKEGLLNGGVAKAD